MNEEIKSNLEHLLKLNFDPIKDISIEKMFSQLINENPKAFNVNLKIITDLFDNDDIKLFKKAKKNPELNVAFENVKTMELNEVQIVADLKMDILNSIPKLKNKIEAGNKGFKNQIIFLEYDHEPYANFFGFGKGDYPILKEPGYFEFNFREELYAGIGKVDYSQIWKELIALNEVLEDLDVYDHLLDNELYQNLANSVKFKTYLLLHEAFDQIGIQAFDGIEIEKPLKIYGNEHDCKTINIYAFE